MERCRSDIRNKIRQKSFLVPKSLELPGKDAAICASEKLLKTFDDRNSLKDKQEVFCMKRGASRILYSVFADISKTKILNQKAIQLSIDLEKEFDSVDTTVLLWDYIEPACRKECCFWFTIVSYPEELQTSCGIQDPKALIAELEFLIS